MNRSRRWSLGPLEVYAYHDYPLHPWRSPLYVGAWLWPGHPDRSINLEALVPSDSRLRPFSGGSA